MLEKTLKVKVYGSSDLSEFFQEKALSELREDSSRKAQALEQFREWIAKQAHIKKCRTDDNFLLRFLRVKKFTNAEAFKMLEIYLTLGVKQAEFSEELTLDNGHLKELFESGFVFPLKERDQNGCRVLFIRPGKLDVKRYKAEDIVRLLAIIMLTLLEEPETQVSGIVFISDNKGISLEFLSLFSFTDLKLWAKYYFKGFPIRTKLFVHTNIPSFSEAFFKIVKSGLSNKIKNRFHFSANNDLIEKFIDVKILPQEYGGSTPIKEMLDDAKTLIDMHKETLLTTSEQEIDVTAVKDFDDEAVGSFRKLEID